MTESIFQTRFIQTNGVSLHTVLAGQPGKKPILFLHGFPDTALTFKELMRRFAKDYYVVAPNQRGYGKSSKPDSVSAYHVSHLMNDILGLLNALGSKSAHIVAHDWGGIVAWRLASLFPERVESLTILNSPHPVAFRKFIVQSSKQRARSSYIWFFQIPWLPEFVLRRNNYKVVMEAVKRSLVSAKLTEDTKAELYRAWQEPGALTAMINWYRASRSSSKEALKDLKVEPKTLVIWGEKDLYLCPELATASLHHCTNAHLKTISTAGHWVHWDEPELVYETINRHINNA